MEDGFEIGAQPSGKNFEMEGAAVSAAPPESPGATSTGVPEQAAADFNAVAEGEEENKASDGGSAPVIPAEHIPAIAASEVASEEKHDQMVDYLAVQADQLGENAPAASQAMRQQVEKSKHPKQEVVQKQYETVLEIVIARYQQHIHQILETGDQEAALAVIEKVTTLTSEELNRWQVEHGPLDDAQVEQLLKGHINNEVVIDALARFSEAHDVMKHAKQATENEASTPEGGSDTLSEEDNFEVFRDWYQNFDKDMQELLDMADVPGFLRMFFAVEGYGSSLDAYKNGLETKDENKEANTLASLTKVFSKPEATKLFLTRLIGKEMGATVEPDEILSRLESLLNIPENTSPDDKKNLIKQLKNNMIAGFSDCQGLVTVKTRRVEDLNLSTDVMQFLLLNVNKYVEKEKKQKSPSSSAQNAATPASAQNQNPTAQPA